jgi:hypothetical protein
MILHLESNLTRGRQDQRRGSLLTLLLRVSLVFSGRLGTRSGDYASPPGFWKTKLR